MAAYNKTNIFVEDLGAGVHTFTTDDVFIALTTTAADTDTLLGLLTQPTGTGYTAGGQDANVAWTSAAGVATLGTGPGPFQWTAAAADWTPFRFVWAYNQTTVAKADPLIGYWDYGSNLTLGNGESFTVTFTSDKIFDLS